MSQPVPAAFVPGLWRALARWALLKQFSCNDRRIPMGKPRINGKVYDWAKATVEFAGRRFPIGFEAMDYSLCELNHDGLLPGGRGLAILTTEEGRPIVRCYLDGASGKEPPAP